MDSVPASSLSRTMVSIPETLRTPVPEDGDNRPGCCQIQDAAIKFGLLFFGLILMPAGAALLYFGFYTSLHISGHILSDSKIMLTCGFISLMFGLLSFVASIILFTNTFGLYPAAEHTNA